VHYSTDYVLPARHTRPTRSVAVSPLGVYGASKLAGEQAWRTPVRHISSCALPGCIQSRQELSQHHVAPRAERDELRVVNDQTGCPTYADLVAAASVQMLDAISVSGTLRNGTPAASITIACQGETNVGFRPAHYRMGRVWRNGLRSAHPTQTTDPGKAPGLLSVSSDKLERVSVSACQTGRWIERCLAERDTSGSREALGADGPLAQTIRIFPRAAPSRNGRVH